MLKDKTRKNQLKKNIKNNMSQHWLIYQIHNLVHEIEIIQYRTNQNKL
jgi:hypothetical protein